jgi:hypothetical protein
MTRKSKARYGLNRTYRVSPTVKALRAAMMAGLLASASTVALAAPPPVDIGIGYFEAGDITVVNPSTDLYVEGIYRAGGVVAISDYGDVDISNDGTISALAGYYGNSALAAGIYAEAGYDATVVNTGGIDAYAYGYSASALGIYAVAGAYDGYGLSDVQNDGAITVATYSSEDSQSIGIAAFAEYDGDTVDNSGQIVSTATVYAEDYFTEAEAIGITAYSEYGDVSITNSGLINVAAYAYDTSGYLVSSAEAIGISAYGYSVAITNTADIAAFASNDILFGNSVTIGINAEAYADITISNTGDISLAGSSGDGYGRYGYYPNYVYLSGDFTATGIKAESTYGSISIDNSGDISIVDQNPDGGLGVGIRTGDWLNGITARTLLGDSTVSNNGDISITGGEQAVGILATTDSLTRYYDCPPPYDNGNYVCYNRYGGGDAKIVNSGDINIATGDSQTYFYAYAAGIVAGTGKYGGDATITNTGDITIINNATTGQPSAVGIVARSSGKYSLGSSIVRNSGDITVMASYSATGIGAYSTNDARIYNSGDITVETVDARSRALYAIADQVGYINNSGDLSVIGGIGAIGAGAAGGYGATTINTGDISVTSTVYETYYSDYFGEQVYLGGWAYGAFASSRAIGVAKVLNSGDIDVHGVNKGTGLSANSRFGSTYIANSGDLDVVGGITAAYGIQTKGASYEEFLNGEVGYTKVYNSGDMTVTSNNLAGGIYAVSQFGDITIENSGDLDVTAETGRAFGILSNTFYGYQDIVNIGDMTVTAVENATGILATTNGYVGPYYNFPSDISVVNDGEINIASEYGRGIGIQASSTEGDVSVQNYNDVKVESYLAALGVRANSNYGSVSIENAGDISVSSSTYTAIGLRAQSNYGDVYVANSGNVNAQAETLAQGIVALNYYYGVEVVNNGDVSASSANGYAQAIAVRSAIGAVISNYGSVTAIGEGDTDVAISVTGAGSVINNDGDISGGIITDDGDDFIYNNEDGRIFLTDDTIDLAGGYNYFLNDGKVYADGVNNVINMGSYYGGEGGYYYGLFVNNGSSIHMNDGAADDSLTIIGNFSGSGDLDVDVDGATLSSDTLYIQGDVLAGTANTINIDLLTLPSAAAVQAGATITIVEVSGNSADTDFTLGTVFLVNSSLFTADYTLTYDGSEFALGFDVTGLSTSGVLMSSVSPAIQNMWYGSLGTMYQRQGGERQFLKETGTADIHGAAGTWTRIYTNDGSMTPSAERNNFGSAGSQDFSFNNQGIEFGVGYSFTQAWTVGLLGGIVDGNFKPDVGGSSDINSTTIGGYVTFTPGNGFYADLSYRGFNFDGQAFGDAPSIPFSGDASGYSLELGYGFKAKSGLIIEPQLQYSSVDVSLDEIRSGNDDFELTDGDSSMIRAGVALRKSYEQHSGVWTPYTSLNYVDITSASNNYLIGGVLEGGVDVSGGSFLLELGTDAKYGDLLFNLGVGVQDGGAYEFVYNAQMNVRYTW